MITYQMKAEYNMDQESKKMQILLFTVTACTKQARDKLFAANRSFPP